MFHVEMLSRGDALSVLISKRKSHKGGDEGTTESKGANTNIMIKIPSRYCMQLRHNFQHKKALLPYSFLNNL